MNFSAYHFFSGRHPAWLALTLVAVFIALLCTACGKKGALYLPDNAYPPKKTDNQIIAPEAPPLKNIPTTSP